ncbi:MAG: hypothetical protein ACE15C_05120 [Phycisphaerae bacterium]
MKTRSISFVSLLSLLVVLAPAAGAPLADKLPADSLFYIGWAGQNDALDGSMFGQLLKEPACADLLGAIKQAVDKKIDGEDQRKLFDSAWSLAGMLWRHPCAVALVDLRKVGDEPAPSAVLLVDLGKDRADFAKLLDGVLSSPGLPPLEDAQAGDLKYRSLKPSKEVEIGLGYKGDIFFLAIAGGKDGLAGIVSPAKALGDSKKFADAMKAVGGKDEQVAFFVDIAGLSAKVAALVPAEEDAKSGPSPKKVLEEIGLSKAGALAGTVRIVEKGMYSKAKLFSPAPHTGLLMLLAGGELTDGDLAGVPEDAYAVIAAKCSLSKVYAELKRVLGELDKDAKSQMLAQVAAFSKATGVALDTDIFDSLGDTWVLSCAGSQGGIITGAALSVSVKDADKLSAAVAKLEEKAKAMLDEAAAAHADDPAPFIPFLSPRNQRMTIEQVKLGGLGGIHYLNMSGIISPVAPAWSVQKDQFYLALWPQVLQTVVQTRQKGEPRIKRLLDDAAFLSARAKVAAKPSCLTYVNTPLIIERLYGPVLVLGTLGANAAGMADVRLKTDWLPALSSLRKYLWPHISAVSAQEDGITFESYGSMPFSGLSVAPAVIPAGVAIAVPTLGQARQQARRAVSMTNLSAIGKACAMFSAMSNDTVPATNYNDLIKQNMISAQSLRSPLSGKGKMPTDDKGMPMEESDYVFIPLPVDAPGNLIQAYEKPEDYGGKGTAILRHDTSVSYVDIKEFKKLLQATQEWLKEKGK